MGNDYYILENGEQTGPFTFDELTDMGLDIHTRVLSPLADSWQDACDLPEFYRYFESLGVYFPTEDNLASFWWRLLAYIIDSVLLSVIFLMLVNVVPINEKTLDLKSESQLLKLQLIIYAIVILYNALCEASPMKGSIGKKICTLAVVDADGLGLTFGNALSRNMGKILSGIVFGIGYLSILWNVHRQAWHDQLANTYVIKRD